ncbi:hypothetical protein [Legionella hackeliae]|uniref:Uridine/cytidine kinase n=3 Tax=Legionella hackeliae TaxID=449 RepID=A0A0A8UX04_LEGHA|nr:hypothetical protein [Legionella hackeliae]KTD15344.1 hypothetical protein Lhac_0186 [Legionella hackeliae]CEK11289.1 protein of unknown function [Legionella hackeliae]STX48058.1 Uncharacterised protein [Legionella hackeliae]
MYVMAICAPLESNVSEFVELLKERLKKPITIFNESDYLKSKIIEQPKKDIEESGPQDVEINFQQLKKDIEEEEGVVLLIGHNFYKKDALKENLGSCLSSKIFFEVSPESCLANFMRKQNPEDVDKAITHYTQQIKPANDTINITKKFANLIIPELTDYSAVLDMICSTLVKHVVEKNYTSQRLFFRASSY